MTILIILIEQNAKCHKTVCKCILSPIRHFISLNDLFRSICCLLVTVSNFVTDIVLFYCISKNCLRIHETVLRISYINLYLQIQMIYIILTYSHNQLKPIVFYDCSKHIWKTAFFVKVLYSCFKNKFIHKMYGQQKITIHRDTDG